MSINSYRTLFSIFLFVFCGCSVFAVSRYSQSYDDSDTIKILLRNSIIVEGDKYTLGEIATLECSDIFLMEKLEKLKIGRSPLPNGNMTVSKSLIKSRLRPHIGSRKIRFNGQNNTKITRSALKVYGSEIEEVVKRYIREKYPNEDMKIKITNKSRDIYLPKGELSYTIKPQREYKNEGGYRTYVVNFKINDKPVKKAYIGIYMKVYKEIYVAKDTIKRNQVIKEADLLKTRRNVDRVPTNYISEKEDIIGKIAKRPIGEKEILKINSLAQKPIITNGDRLLIVFETENLKLTARGVSMGKGCKGERIPVRNMESKAVVHARVISKNLVQVN